MAKERFPQLFWALLVLATLGRCDVSDTGLPVGEPPVARGVYLPSQFGVHRVDISGEVPLKDGNITTVTAHVLLKAMENEDGGLQLRARVFFSDAKDAQLFHLTAEHVFPYHQNPRFLLQAAVPPSFHIRPARFGKADADRTFNLTLARFVSPSTGRMSMGPHEGEDGYLSNAYLMYMHYWDVYVLPYHLQADIKDDGWANEMYLCAEGWYQCALVSLQALQSRTHDATPTAGAGDSAADAGALGRRALHGQERQHVQEEHKQQQHWQEVHGQQHGQQQQHVGEGSEHEEHRAGAHSKRRHLGEEGNGGGEEEQSGSSGSSKGEEQRDGGGAEEGGIEEKGVEDGGAEEKGTEGKQQHLQHHGAAVRRAPLRPRFVRVQHPFYDTSPAVAAYLLHVHTEYHVALGFDGTIVYDRGSYMADLLAVPQLAALAEAGRLGFMLWGHDSSGMPLPYFSEGHFHHLIYDQQFVYNHAALAFWGRNTYLFYADNDDFLALQPGQMVQQLLEPGGCAEGAVYVQMPRWAHSCNTSLEAHVESINSTLDRFASDTWRSIGLPHLGCEERSVESLTGRFDHPKSFVLADAVGHFDIHFGWLLPEFNGSSIEAQPECASVRHLYNVLVRRDWTWWWGEKFVKDSEWMWPFDPLRKQLLRRS